jgi:putative Mg2+ transporter-C (MgtC) family protein
MWDVTALTLEQVIKIAVALALGTVIGFEREWADKPAGIRTHILVCTAACLITIMAYSFEGQEARARLMEGIIVGIGFLGAGTIISSSTSGVRGLTTAASIWITSAIGMTVGSGKYALAALAAVAVFIVLRMGKAKERIGD